jgi:hypothetical protein
MKYFKEKLIPNISSCGKLKFWYIHDIDNDWLATIRFDIEFSFYQSWVKDIIINYSREEYAGPSFNDAHNFILALLNKHGYKPIPQHLEILL